MNFRGALATVLSLSLNKPLVVVVVVVVSFHKYIDIPGTALCHLHPEYSTAYRQWQMAAINSRDEPSWLVAAVPKRLSGIRLLLLLHALSEAAPPGQHLPLHLPKSLTSGSFSCCHSLVLPRLTVRYSWGRQILRVIFMAPDFPHSICDPLSWTWTQWIVDIVIIEHSFHSILFCDIHTARFPLDCSRAAVCPCTLFRVRCRPHSEGCAGVEEFTEIYISWCRNWCNRRRTKNRKIYYWPKGFKIFKNICKIYVYAGI